MRAKHLIGTLRKQVCSRLSRILIATGIIFALASPARSQSTAFTYQGQLTFAGQPANGTYDLIFTLFNTNSGGVSAAGPVTNLFVAVTNGLFTTAIDFGAATFNGASYWLELGVRSNNAGAFTILMPRQPITPAPYAVHAMDSATIGGPP